MIFELLKSKRKMFWEKGARSRGCCVYYISKKMNKRNTLGQLQLSHCMTLILRNVSNSLLADIGLLFLLFQLTYLFSPHSHFLQLLSNKNSLPLPYFQLALYKLLFSVGKCAKEEDALKEEEVADDLEKLEGELWKRLFRGKLSQLEKEWIERLRLLVANFWGIETLSIGGEG